MAIHRLKLHSDYFEAVKNGIKTFEIRKNDRGFKVGDTLILHLWVDTGVVVGYARVTDFISDGKGGGLSLIDRVPEYLADHIVAKVIYITDYEQKDGYVVLGIEV
ncbi:hypothetical protein RyT2_07820 [Pseudolactococcus yaeyamensis]